MLQAQPSDAERDKWIGAVKREALNYGVNPSTLISLGDAGDVDAELSRHGDTGAYARRYNPPLPSEILLVYPYLLASWTGSLISIPYAVFLAASVALGQEDMRFRVAPVPMLLLFAVAGALSSPWGPYAWAVIAIPLAAAFALTSFVMKKVGGVIWHAGDYLTLAIALTAVLSAGTVFEFLATHLLCACILELAIRHIPACARLKDNVPYNAVLSVSLVGATLIAILKGYLL
ncbi:hypothetical protein [Collinsella sp. i06-0019-1H4]|uniref:hypothetical protein n=1 Tax=Collinsella sp. i06-0019-1H4 TaxID=3132706 RepID=UPI0036F31A4A